MSKSQTILERRVEVMRPPNDVRLVGETPGFLSANCKRGSGRTGCSKCFSLKCSHECHTRQKPVVKRV